MIKYIFSLHGFMFLLFFGFVSTRSLYYDETWEIHTNTMDICISHIVLIQKRENLLLKQLKFLKDLNLVPNESIHASLFFFSSFHISFKHNGTIHDETLLFLKVSKIKASLDTFLRLNERSFFLILLLCITLLFSCQRIVFTLVSKNSYKFLCVVYILYFLLKKIYF
jgi:hypothetical protein